MFEHVGGLLACFHWSVATQSSVAARCLQQWKHLSATCPESERLKHWNVPLDDLGITMITGSRPSNRCWPPHRADWAFGEDRPSQLWFQRGACSFRINRRCLGCSRLIFLFPRDAADAIDLNEARTGTCRTCWFSQRSKQTSQALSLWCLGLGILWFASSKSITSLEDEHPSKWNSIDSNTAHCDNSRLKSFTDIRCNTSLFHPFPTDSRRTPSGSV